MILQVADRPGWALDKLSKPLPGDHCYHWSKPDRYLATGYTPKEVLGVDKVDLSKYDIIHFHKQDAAKIILKQCPQARKIVTKHTERDEGTDWQMFDDIICPTIACYEQMKAKYPNTKVHFVPTGIDLKFYGYDFKDKKDKLAGYVGRVVEWKRWSKIVKACKEAKIKLIAAGYIENSKEFHNHNSLKGQDFEFMNFFPEGQMRDFYNRLSLFICLSKPGVETGPLPVLEAMACGVPVISTRVGWANDWCTHEENIWFVEENNLDLDRLPRIIKNLIDRNDVTGKIAQNGMRLVQNFSIEKYIERIKRIYNDPDFISTPEIIKEEIYGKLLVK